MKKWIYVVGSIGIIGLLILFCVFVLKLVNIVNKGIVGIPTETAQTELEISTEAESTEIVSAGEEVLFYEGISEKGEIIDIYSDVKDGIRIVCRIVVAGQLEIQMEKYKIPANGMAQIEVYDNCMSIFDRVALNCYFIDWKQNLIKSFPCNSTSQAISISSNMKKLAYYDSEKEKTIIRNIDTSEEKELTSTKKIGLSGVTIYSMRWSTDGTMLMFSGDVCEKENEDAKECYGWIEEQSDVIHIFYKNDAEIAYWGNYIIMFSHSLPYGKNSDGKVIYVDITTGEKKVFHTEDVNENQWIQVLDADTFVSKLTLVMEDKEIYRVYHNGTKCDEFELKYGDQYPSIIYYFYNMKEKRMFVQQYDFDTGIDRYRMKELKHET